MPARSLLTTSLAVLTAFLPVSTASSEAAPDVATVSSPSEVLVAWNEAVLTAAEAEDRFLTLKGLRTAALMHLAIHDALNTIAPRYRTYLPVESPKDGALRERGVPLAAATEAAFRVAVSQYPDRRETFEAERRRWLAAVPAGVGRELGKEVGGTAVERILAAREGDGWDNEAEYRFHPMAPGVYAEFAEHSGTPEGFVIGAGWATARPFVLASPDHFRASPPPAIESPEYTRAYDEVKEMGRHQSPARTPDQTHLAMWWKEFVESSHNRLARELVAEEDLDLWDAARMFALLEMSIFDAYVNVFENKFHYNHWRPYTAIRWAANDGNPDTEPDPEWNNTHRHTYPFPSYPSAHGTACAAAMNVFASVFGDDRPVTMTIPRVDVAGPLSEKIEMDPATRSFPSFSAAARECALSRVYLGIHFRYDSEAGIELGTKVGRHVIETALRPLPTRSPAYASEEMPRASADVAEVESIARDYIEGWYTGDVERMDRALHDDLVKQMPIDDGPPGESRLHMVSKARMLEMTAEGGGENPEAEFEIFVDDVSTDIAAGRVVSPEYVDYLHLVKTPDGWKIVHALFRMRP